MGSPLYISLYDKFARACRCVRPLSASKNILQTIALHMSSGHGTYTQLDRKFDQDMIYWLCITRGTSVTIASPFTSRNIQKVCSFLCISCYCPPGTQEAAMGVVMGEDAGWSLRDKQICFVSLALCIFARTDTVPWIQQRTRFKFDSFFSPERFLSICISLWVLCTVSRLHSR